MFKLALAIGIYSYLILFLGLSGFFIKNNILILSILYWSFAFFYIYSKNRSEFNLKKGFDKLSILCFVLLGAMSIVNLIGVLGPEISFDALWYHLTLPKLYLYNQSIFHIPGSLLYYSDMPKLTEMLYTAALSMGNEILTKFIHFIFGILTLFATYKISRKFFSLPLSLIAALIFYSNLVVAWESIISYSDLSRTFFEIMAFWAFINGYETKNKKWFFLSGALMGFAISVKLLAIASVFIFICLFIVLFKNDFKNLLKNILFFILPTFIIPLPWFIFSYINTGNPIYPFFDTKTNIILQSSSNLFDNFLKLFLFSPDPISPIYLIVLPILILSFLSAPFKIRLLYIYSILALTILLITPSVGGGRFMLAYLPVFSILSIYVIGVKNKLVKTIIISTVILIMLSSIGYRTLANAKYVPVILSLQSKSDFLTKNLNFKFGDFYDTDNYFKHNIQTTDKILLYGFHNLYYVDFPFIHSTWLKYGDKFNYIATQNTQLPKRYINFKLCYYNKITNVKLYGLEDKLCLY